MSKLRKLKRAFCILLLLALALGFCGVVAFYFAGGVSHRDLQASILDEHAQTRAEVDLRADEIDSRLDRIESKLDRLLELASPRLPDDMKEAE